MSIQEQKITEAAIAANGVQSRPDKLTGTAAQNKKVFDALVTAVVKERFNALLDELTGTTAAAHQKHNRQEQQNIKDQTPAQQHGPLQQSCHMVLLSPPIG